MKIEAIIEAEEISGQVAIGKNILQVGVNKGVIIYQTVKPPPEPRPRPRPVSLPPRKPGRFLNREREISLGTEAVETAEPLEFQGRSGLGKSTLLGQIAHAEDGAGFADGVVHVRVARKPLEDVLEELYEAFHRVPREYKPSSGDVRHGLAGIEALVFLDDFELPRDDARELLDYLPNSAFVLAASESRLVGLGETHPLSGLPLDEAVELFAAELGRGLKEDELPSARSICQALEGHPLHVVQAARRVRRGMDRLAAVAEVLDDGTSGDELALDSALAAPEDDEKLLAPQAVVGGAPLSTRHLKDITGLGNAERRLERMAAAGLLESGLSFRLAGTLAEDLREAWGDTLDTWGRRVLEHFIGWAERLNDRPEEILESSEAVRGVLQWAVDEELWEDVIRLGQAVDGALARTARWGAWREILELVLQAAVKGGDVAAEAWALHQLGSRAFGLGDLEAAQRMLSSAAELREAAGDSLGQAISEHNLRGARGEPLPPPPDGGGFPWLPAGAGIVLLVAVVGAGLVWGNFPPRPSTPEPTQRVIVPPASETPAPTPSDTPPLSPTPTPTITAVPSPPDLVVPQFMVERLPFFDVSGRMLFPAYVEVSNIGDLPADDFKVSTSYIGSLRGPNTPFVVPFTVPGQSDPRYPRPAGPLEGGETVAFDGVISLDPVENDRALSLTALADSCAGEEFVPEECHVPESDEGNNTATVRLRTPPCFDFNELEPDRVLEVGAEPIGRSGGILEFGSLEPFELEEFGISAEDGRVEVGFGWSQSLFAVQNMQLRVSFGGGSVRTALAYDESKGLQVIEIEDQRLYVQDFEELAGERFGGTVVNVLRESADQPGVLVLDGPLSSLAVGNIDGSLQVDNLCWMIP